MISIEDLVASVEKGADWLGKRDSDPPGRFYFWWLAGMTPTSPMPGQPQEVRAAYGEWYRGYTRWTEVYRELERRSSSEAQQVMEGIIGEAEHHQPEPRLEAQREPEGQAARHRGDQVRPRRAEQRSADSLRLRLDG